MIDKAAHQILPSTPSEITSSENSSIKVDRPKPLPALLFSLLPLLLVGLVIFGFLTGPLRFVQSEQTGPTSESREIGQRIRAEHAALKAITVRLPAQQVVSQELKLHLRRFSDSQDLRVSGNGQPGKEAGWVRFEFAPLEAQYRGQSLFFLLEQGGTPFQLIGDEQNVYLGGEGFIDGQATGGDLAFELEYAPDPAGLLGIYFERQTAYGGLPWIGMVALALWIGLAIGGCLALVLRPARFIPEKLRQMTGRQFRPVALYFLLMGFFGMLAFMFITPPLQGLDEQGHVGRTVFVYEYNSAPARYPQLYAEIYQLEKQGRYSEYIPGFSYDNPEIDFANLSPLSETYQPPVYYAVAGGVLRLGSWLTGNHSLLFQMYMVRLASLLFGLGTLGVGLVWAYYLRREAPWLVLVVPGAVAMLPTYLFISGVANNDNAVNFFTSLVIFGLTVLYKEGRTQNYNRVFWRKWWPVLVIVAGSAVLSYQSKHTSGAFLGGLAFGVFVYFCFLTSKRVRLGLLLGVGALLVLIGVFLIIRPPWQLAALTNFLEGTGDKSRTLATVQVSILTFESFWCSAGWVNFSDLGDGRIMLGFFLLSLLVLWGVFRALNLKKKSQVAETAIPQPLTPDPRPLAFILGIATLAHLLFLILYRVLTTYGRPDDVVEFPQGRFFLLALLPLSAIFFVGLRMAIPARLRKLVPVWFGYYLWFFGLLAYALLMLFGGFLPYYYNQN